MHPAFTHAQYHVKRQAIALTGKVRFYTTSNQLVLFSEQKMFRLREDIRVYGDESKTQELLTVKARNIVDFSAAYDVVDALSGIKVGVLRRKGLRSILRDQWEVLDAQDQPFAVLEEDTAALALVRRFLTSLVPQNYDITAGGSQIADLKQRFNPLRYELDLDFRMDTAGRLDRRIGIAAALLLAIVEGRQG